MADDEIDKHKVFEAIKNFVEDLWSVFESKTATPLALYRRLLSTTKPTDKIGIDKFINGFVNFFARNDKFILDNKLDLIDRGAAISYGTSESIKIEIQMFIHKSGLAEKEVIRQHLMTISTLIAPDPEKMEKLTKGGLIDPSTKEGRFVSEILDDAREQFDGMDVSNPTQAIMSLASSGIMGKMTKAVQEGGMNKMKLLGAFKGALDVLMEAEMKNNAE
jgi:hypothetical protein